MAEVEESRSAIFAYADQYVNERAVLDPIFGTDIGMHEVDHLLPDFSSGQEHRNLAHTQAALEHVTGLQPGDERDRIARAVMIERLESQLELERSGELRRTWGVIHSPLSAIRQAFELMDATTTQNADVIRQRM